MYVLLYDVNAFCPVMVCYVFFVLVLAITIIVYYFLVPPVEL